MQVLPPARNTLWVQVSAPRVWPNFWAEQSRTGQLCRLLLHRTVPFCSPGVKWVTQSHKPTWAFIFGFVFAMEYKSLIFWRIHYERDTILIPLWRKNRTSPYATPVFPGLDSCLTAAGHSHICAQINTRLRCQISLLKWTTTDNRTAENRKFVWRKPKDSITVTKGTLKYQPHLEHI